MPHLGFKDAFCTLDGTLIHGESDSVALEQRRDMGPRLHPRTLFGEGELPAFEVLSRLREQDRDLDREYFGPVKVLVQPVVIARTIREKQRRRPAAQCARYDR